MKRILMNPWWVVLGSALALSVSQGPIYGFTFSVLLKPVTETFGWDRSTFSAALLVATVLGGLTAPFVGRFVDRRGVLAVTLPGMVLFGLCVAAISLTPASSIVFIALYGLAGISGATTGPMSYSKAVSGWFDRHRGLALGITVSGSSLGTALAPVIAQRLIDSFGWRGAYVGLGIIAVVVAFPAVVLLVREPERRSSRVAASPALLPGKTRSEAIRTQTFWIIFLTAFLVILLANGTVTHLVAILTDRGMSAGEAAGFAALFGLASVAGRLVCGYLLDRIHARYVITVIYLLPCLAIPLLIESGTNKPFIALAAMLLGFVAGSEIDAVGFLVSRYFGLRAFGEIFGLIFMLFAFASGLGPYLMGLSFDLTKSYTTGFVGFGICALIASVMISRLGPYAYAAGSSITTDEAKPAAVR